MKLVEIIRGLKTVDSTVAPVKAVAEKMGKVAVVCKDSPGFIVNRLLDPMLNEAVFLVYENVSTVEEIDLAVVNGLNHPMGPLKLADLIGLDIILAVTEVLYRQFADPKYRPCPLLKTMVRAGELGVKTKKGFYTYE
ncbi:putative 3-hydroxybutyryl-CoA dehydrogenase [bioreactor metagenome]|uniref:Putative 3-hydroxybutyryl-CoA dehydrogenase n=1 Tax=bioreactor metagenome TaxID=1076179 RepID=A0A645JUW7_9ZZZZ